MSIGNPLKRRLRRVLHRTAETTDDAVINKMWQMKLIVGARCDRSRNENEKRMKRKKSPAGKTKQITRGPRERRIGWKRDGSRDTFYRSGLGKMTQSTMCTDNENTNRERRSPTRHCYILHNSIISSWFQISVRSQKYIIIMHFGCSRCLIYRVIDS